jgi:hypothetical protein
MLVTLAGLDLMETPPAGRLLDELDALGERPQLVVHAVEEARPGWPQNIVPCLK